MTQLVRRQQQINADECKKEPGRLYSRRRNLWSYGNNKECLYNVSSPLYDDRIKMKQPGEKSRWKFKCQMSTEELEQYVNRQFDELHRLVRLEEWRVLHLVDLKEAFLTAQAAESISEISVHTEKLQEEMDSITQQLVMLDKAEQDGVAPKSLAPLLTARTPPSLGAVIEPGRLDPEVRLRVGNQMRVPEDHSVDEEKKEDAHMGHVP